MGHVADKLRELLLPLTVLAIVGSLWVQAVVQEREESSRRALPPVPEALLLQNLHPTDDTATAAVDFES